MQQRKKKKITDRIKRYQRMDSKRSDLQDQENAKTEEGCQLVYDFTMQETEKRSELAHTMKR